MRRITLIISGLALLALGMFWAGALPVLADGPEDLAAVRARFEGQSKAKAVAAGYAPDVVCVGTPAGIMGWHGEKYPFNEDNLVNALDPEVLLLYDGQVKGIEYETHDVSVPRPSLFGYEFDRTEGHAGKEWPHYALHIHFLPDAKYYVGPFNPAQRCPTPPTSTWVAQANVALKNAQGEQVGSGTFTQDPLGYVLVDVEVKGLAPGGHGFHIHTVGNCVATDFTSAGGHFNPLARQHGVKNPGGAHSGDLPSFIVDNRGVGHIRVTTDRATLTAGATTVFDADGSALVVHASDDDHVTDPTGNAGARVACGVIEAAAPAVLPRTGDRLPWAGPLAVLAGLVLLAAGIGLRRVKA